MNVCISVTRNDYDKTTSPDKAVLNALLRTCRQHNINVEEAHVKTDRPCIIYRVNGNPSARVVYINALKWHNITQRMHTSIHIDNIDTPF